MALATYLVDKSALARVGINDVAKTLRPLIGRGLTATAGIVAPEMLFSARIGQHRAVSPTDLLIAAIAERHRVSVLHYDGDFEFIARITGQPTQWVVPRASV